MKPEDKLLNKLKQFKSKPGVEIPAFLGDLNGVVKADNNNNVYVVLFNGQVEVVKNNIVPNIPRLPVVIGYRQNSTALEVLRLRDVYDDPPYVNIPDHAEKTHGEFDVDPVRITSGQFLPGLAFPIAGTLKVFFFGREYYLNGWHVVANQTIDFTDKIPVTEVAYMIMVEIDESGVISFRNGADKESRELLVREDIPVPVSTKAPLFAVSTYYGQTEIRKEKTYTDIYDLRFAGMATGGGASYIEWSDVLSVPLYLQDASEHTHATWRWTATGGTTFDLPDYAYQLNAVYDNALRVDPLEVGLSDDGVQIVFSTAPMSGHAITADYILRKLG